MEYAEKIGEWEVRIIRSRRKTIGLQIDDSLAITVKVPFQMSSGEIRRFVERQSGWIGKHCEIIRKRQEERGGEAEAVLTREEINRLAERALAYIPERVALFAPIVKVSYGRITIRNQRSRWGSCSGKGNLNFNCLLMLMPPEVIDYVVVHELCHRREMNHSADFWRLVEEVLPDYKKHRQWLKENGAAVMRRMTG